MLVAPPRTADLPDLVGQVLDVLDQLRVGEISPQRIRELLQVLDQIGGRRAAAARYGPGA